MGVGLSGGRGSRPPFRSVPIEALRPLCGQFRSTALDLEVTIVERNGKILLEREGASPLWLRVPRAKRTFQPSKGNLVQSLVFRLNEEDTNDAFLLHIKGGGRAIFHRVEESTR